MFKRLLVLVLALCLMSSVCPAPISIMLISDSGYVDEWGNMWFPDADGKNVAQGGKFNDSTLVDWLTGLGYTVDMSGMAGAYRDNKATKWYQDATKLEAINNADLVFFSRFTSSGSYDGADNLTMQDRYYWNTLEKPLINQNGDMCQIGAPNTAKMGLGSYARFGWTNNGSDTKYVHDNTSPAATEMDWSVLKLDMDTQIFDWSALGGLYPNNSHRPKLPYGDWVDGAQLIGFFDDVWTAAEIATKPLAEQKFYQDKPILVDIYADTDFDDFIGSPDGFYGYAGGNRVYFGIWGYDGVSNITNPNYQWGVFLTDTYKDLLAQTIAAKIPEPATIALLGLGGLALLRKKR